MFIYKIALCSVIFLFTSCSSLPDISITNNTDLEPWLTLSDNPAISVDISWLTSGLSQTILYFGENKENLQKVSTKKGFRKLHKVSFTNLQEGKTYYYSVNNKIYNFSTASARTDNYTITVLGDLQPFNRQTRHSNRIMAQAMVQQDSDLIVQLGDVSEDGNLNFMLAETLNNISTYASHIPFLATAGNHDYYNVGNKNFRKLFPYNYPSEDDLYHSIQYKNSSLIFLDIHTENKDISDEQKKWFEGELEKAAALENNWIFVMVHDVVLSQGSRSMQLQKWLVPLVDRFGVDAVLFGHSHNYFHWIYQYGESGLVHNKEDSPSGKEIHYFCSGGGGAKIGTGSVHKNEYLVKDTEWLDSSSSESVIISDRSEKWDALNFIDQRENPINGNPPEHKNYYQLPGLDSDSEYSSIYGYQYGEKTLHYINMDFSGDENEICTISVHYPDGELLSGPGGEYPQEWVLRK